MSTPANPLSDLTDTELWNIQVLMSLVCGRNHSSLTKKRRQYACRLAQPLKVEADLRGLSSPQPPYGVGDFKHDDAGAV